MVKMDYVWDRTVEFLGDHLSALLPFAVLGIFVPTAIMNAISPLWGTAGTDLKLVLTVAIVVLVLAMLWASLAITALAIDPAARSHAARVATQRLLPMIGAYLVLILGFVALFLPISAFAAFAGMDMAAMEAGQPMRLTSPAMGWALVLYALAFLVIVLVIVARIVPLSAVIVAERRGLGTLARAWRLTRRMSWRLIGVVILYFVVSQVAGLAARTVFGSLLRVVAGGEGPVTIGGVITAAIVAAVSTGFTTLAAVFAAKLYVAICHTLESAPAPLSESGAAVL